MKPTRSLPRRWACPVIILCALGLLGAAALGEEGRGPAAKREAKRVAKMVDALANRNKPPKLVTRRRPDLWPRRLPLYPEGYDWKEERRVHRALDALLADRTAELWEELVRRWDDEPYCVVVMDGSMDDAFVVSVGSVCRNLAHDRLVGVFRRHLPDNPYGDGRPLRLDVGFDARDLASWREVRAKKSLYELQVEACEEAVRQLAKVKGLSKEERAKARKKIEAEVARLRRAKRPDLPKFPEHYLKTYNAKDAKVARKAIQDSSIGDIGDKLTGERCR
jgi:hypothetical protein